MNTFRRKSLYAALAGMGALGATGAAQAVNVNPDGLGQVLLYPYYTTRADSAGNVFNSLLSVVNSTASAKAVKVRVLEGKNSQEVIDFNLFLSAFDVWTAAIGPSTSGGGARLATADRSCTLPIINTAGTGGAVDFVNYAYSSDGGDSSLDRTREGYVEIIEMGSIVDRSPTWSNITHSPPGGSPPGCAKVTDTQAALDTTSLTGGIFGGMTLINVAAGTDYTEDAVALDNFKTTPGNLYFAAGTIFPDLRNVTPPQSTVFTTGGTVVTSTWGLAGGQAVDAVSAILMHDNVMNEFVLDPGTKSGTDWVVTMPTKKFYIGAPAPNNSLNTGSANGATGRLFQRNFGPTSGSCDDINLTQFDREEQSVVTQNFSPPQNITFSLCWEANVLTFNNSSVLGSKNSANVSTGFANGWARLGFPVPAGTAYHTLGTPVSVSTPLGGAPSAPGTATYFGLPVIGFAVQSFSNGFIPGASAGSTVLSNYGGNFVHKTTRLITP